MPYADPVAKRANARERYYRNHEKSIAERVAYNRVRNARLRAWMDELKSAPCTLCGGKFHPRCMDFHHRNPSEKSFKPSTFMKYSKDRIHAELAKCDLLCANCHRLTEAGISSAAKRAAV